MCRSIFSSFLFRTYGNISKLFFYTVKLFEGSVILKYKICYLHQDQFILSTTFID